MLDKSPRFLQICNTPNIWARHNPLNINRLCKSLSINRLRGPPPNPLNIRHLPPALVFADVVTAHGGLGAVVPTVALVPLVAALHRRTRVLLIGAFILNSHNRAALRTLAIFIFHRQRLTDYQNNARAFL